MGGWVREGEDVGVEAREERFGGRVRGDEAGEEGRRARRGRGGRGGEVEEESESDGRGGGVAAEEREQVGGGGGGGHGRVAAGGGGERLIGLNRPGLAARWGAQWGQRPGPLTLRSGPRNVSDLLRAFFFSSTFAFLSVWFNLMKTQLRFESSYFIPEKNINIHHEIYAYNEFI